MEKAGEHLYREGARRVSAARAVSALYERDTDSHRIATPTRCASSVKRAKRAIRTAPNIIWGEL